MSRSVLRVLFVLIVLSILALPASAQYPGCKECRTACFSDGSCVTDCPDRQTEGWAWDHCEFRQYRLVQICRGAGASCYYLEVQG